MKLHFDSNQEYQQEAIKAITEIFEGQPLSRSDFEFSINGFESSFNCQCKRQRLPWNLLRVSIEKEFF